MYDPDRSRPAKNPGGMECNTCGAIFIGEEWHADCRVCDDLKREIRIGNAAAAEFFKDVETDPRIVAAKNKQ